MINVYQPSLGKEELDALEKVFESNWLGKGKRVAEFEEKYAEHINSSKEINFFLIKFQKKIIT